jgi:hypothetical protein
MTHSARRALAWTRTTMLSNNTLTITLNGNNIWVFASEFEFTADTTSVIPEPSTFIIAASGVSEIALLRRRRLS